jgi:hypothetical protein
VNGWMGTVTGKSESLLAPALVTVMFVATAGRN